MARGKLQRLRANAPFSNRKTWGKPDQFEAFERFETAAFAIMETHGVKVLEVVKTHAALDGAPHEIHRLAFPSRVAFEAYRSDPELLALGDLRESCIAKTEVIFDNDPDL